MLITPPIGSKISVTTEGPDEVIVIPYSGGGVLRYLAVLFMLVWLTLWTFGLAGFGWAAYSGTLQGNASAPGVAGMFVAMALGEIWGIFLLYRLLRPAVPESLKLQFDSVAYDSGIPPVRPLFGFGYRSPADVWQALFPRRKRIELDLQQVRAIRLRETDSGNRLTFDLGSTRIDIARGATEIEREWLAKVLSERYGGRR
jgi:hypothetical protein